MPDSIRKAAVELEDRASPESVAVQDVLDRAGDGGAPESEIQEFLERKA